MNNVLLVVPTYNESENLPAFVDHVMGVATAADILVVDDNSPDGTGRLAEELARRNRRIRVLHRPGKTGLGRAYVEGFAWALERNYEFVFEIDADLSHDPRDIPRFLDAAQNADCVLGSRYLGGIRIMNWPLGRLLLSKSAASFVRIVTGMPFSDPTGGYKCFRKRALRAALIPTVNSNGYGFQVEITHRLWRKGFRIVEVPIIFTDRFQGTSKMSKKIVREAFILVWRLWLENGMRRIPWRGAGTGSVIGECPPSTPKRACGLGSRDQ